MLTKNQLGSMTIMNQLGIGETKEQPAETMTTGETQTVAPVPPEDREIETKQLNFLPLKKYLVI